MRNTALRVEEAPKTWSREIGERRANHRLRTVYCVSRVSANGDLGLARLLNISNEGMMLSHSLDVRPGDHLRVDLSEDRSYETRVIWRDGLHCGVRLRAPIDCVETVKGLCEDRRACAGRPLRLPLSKEAMASSELGLHRIRLQDVSQNGLNVFHDGRFKEGLAVKVRLAAGIERRGVVRWLQDGRAGIALRDLLTVEQLGSANKL
ncbi:MAG TPA: PilZ domain-containing protein [Sphingomonas sp.]|nr:PilZ domain-containing protein [Sphingomonas sp.]